MDQEHVPDKTPVLVGVGLVSQKMEDPIKALEPLELMLQAVWQAGRDSGSEKLLRFASKISVPKGRWRYADPGRFIARKIGTNQVVTELGLVGVLQQTLIGDACQAIRTGEHKAVLVVGGEAGYRILRGKKSGIEIADTEAGGTPDSVLRAQTPLRSETELAAGLNMPIGLYAMLDCSLRTSRGETVGQRLSRIGSLYEDFCRVAADNPHAWSRQLRSVAEINTPSPANRLQAMPYTKHHCSNWSVDQASALFIMSAGLARELGISSQKWVFAMGSSESNHMETVTSRRVLHRSPGAKAAGNAILEHAGIGVGEVDLLDLYSCFPVALDMVADELGISRTISFTITGGMASAGGPYNNYVLHSTAQMAQKLRQGAGSTGLVGCISGIVTKQAFGLWSVRPPTHPFEFTDVTSDVARTAQPFAEAEGYKGKARVVAWTVLNSKDGSQRAIAIANTTDGRRCVAYNAEAGFVVDIAERDIVGASVEVLDGVFTLD